MKKYMHVKFEVIDKFPSKCCTNFPHVNRIQDVSFPHSYIKIKQERGNWDEGKDESEQEEERGQKWKKRVEKGKKERIEWEGQSQREEIQINFNAFYSPIL